MAKANEEKSGDKLAGVAAASAQERVAAKLVLSEVHARASCARTRSCPTTKDAVTRLIQDELQPADLRGRQVAGPSSQLREHVLDEHVDGRRPAAPVARAHERDDRGLRQADVEPRPRRGGAEDPRRRARATTRSGCPGACLAPAAEPPVRRRRRHPRVAEGGPVASAAATRCSASTRSPTTPSRRARSSTRRTSFIAEWQRPDAELLPGARHHADEGARARARSCDLMFQSLARHREGDDRASA